MANYDIARERTLNLEGGYSNDPDDPGGRTAFGIAENYWPQYWQNGAPEEEDAILFYRNEFWQRMRGDDIKDQLIANEIFDTGVNCGRSTFRFAQEVYNRLTDDRRGSWPELEVDGRIGPKTVKAINAFTDASLSWRDAMLAALDFRQGSRYWNGNAKYRRGWFAARIGKHHTG